MSQSNYILNLLDIKDKNIKLNENSLLKYLLILLIRQEAKLSLLLSICIHHIFL